MTNATTNGSADASGSARRMSLNEACKLFTDRVKTIEDVQEVILVRDPENYPVIWTVVSAERFNFDVRSPIYDVECDLLSVPQMPILDFRILNLQETASDNLWDYLPNESSVSLWKREHASTG